MSSPKVVLNTVVNTTTPPEELTMSNNLHNVGASATPWDERFTYWPTVAVRTRPDVKAERITLEEFKSRVNAMRENHEAEAYALALSTILGAYRCVIKDEDGGEDYLCESTEDFFIMDEHYVHCYSPDSGEYVGWFLFIPYNGSVAESFADWTTGSSSFDRFLSSLTEELDT
jgi:hypothetical protein